MTRSASHLLRELCAKVLRSPIRAPRGGRVVLASAVVLAVGAWDGRADEADVYPRGDADCSLRWTAVDAVATVRGVGGASVCGNDDCDRDGAVSVGDIDCAARCLFGPCPIPSHAPAVTSVVPDSAAAVAPFSSVRVIGLNFGAVDDYARATFDGVEAAVADHPEPDELLVMVPPVGPGEVEVVIYRGDLAGSPFRVNVEAPAPIGPWDTFAGTLDLLDEMMRKFALLDLESYLGEEAASVREEIDRFQQELAANRAEMDADPDFSPELRDILDDAFEGSGIPERLRETIAELESYAAAEGGAAADVEFTVAISVAKNVIRTLVAVRNTAQTVALPAAVAGAAPAAAGIGVPAMLGIAALTVAAGAILAAVAAKSGVLAPVILAVTLLDPTGEHSRFAIPGAEVEILAKRAWPLSAVTMAVKSAGGGSWVLTPEQTGQEPEGTLRFQFPAPDSGFCRDVAMQLRHSATGASAIARRRVQPRMMFFTPNEARPQKGFNVRASGAVPCEPRTAIFTGFYASARVPKCEKCFSDFIVPNVVAGKYSVELEVAGVPSYMGLPFTVLNPFTGLQIDCAPRDLVLFPASPDSSDCASTLLPGGGDLPPGARIDWRSTDSGIASASPDNEEGTTATVKAQGPGTADVTAALKAGDDELLASGPVGITVKDTTPPFSVTLRSDSPATVPAGSAIEVTVTASDLGGVHRVRLTATGEAVVEPQQLEFCPGDRTCEVSFTVQIKEAGFEQKEVSIVAEAIDTSEHASSSNTLRFTIAPEARCPQVAILSPLAGLTVAPNATVAVEAEALDNRPGDTGVVRWVYSASGDALVQAIADEQQLPAPVNDQPVRLNFDFTAKGAEAIAALGDRTITISVEAIDAAGNTCGPQVITVSAAAPGPEVSVTLTWDGVEDLDLQVNVCQQFFCLLNRNTGAADANGSCAGSGSGAVETIELRGEDAPLWRYFVHVTYDQSCGAPLRPVPFHVHVEYDNQVLDRDGVVEPFKSVEVTQFDRQ